MEDIIKESQNYLGWKVWFNPLAMSRYIQNYIRLFRALFNLTWNVSRASTTSLGNNIFCNFLYIVHNDEEPLETYFLLNIKEQVLAKLLNQKEIKLKYLEKEGKRRHNNSTR